MSLTLLSIKYVPSTFSSQTIAKTFLLKLLSNPQRFHASTPPFLNITEPGSWIKINIIYRKYPRKPVSTLFQANEKKKPRWHSLSQNLELEPAAMLEAKIFKIINSWTPRLIQVGAREPRFFLRSKFVFLSRGPSSRLLARVLRGIIWFIYISSMDMLLFLFFFSGKRVFCFLHLMLERREMSR